MSTTHVFLLSLYLFLSLNFLGMTMASRPRLIPHSAPSTVTRPLFLSETETFMVPNMDHKEKGFQGRQVNDCLPKGFRHNSAPSRFMNYNTLGSGSCSGMYSKKP